jgi:transcriptional regulator with XRE-family HTH domain
MLNLEVKDAVPLVSYAVPRMETMGDRIKQLRVARGYSQEAFGKLVGVTKSAVSQWEDGSSKNVKLQTFLKVLEVLHTDANYLIWGDKRSPNDPSSTGKHRALRPPKSSET